jgi:putative ABC transport system substrate-binding protein
MRRRDFISLLGGAAVVWPLAARAQQPAPVVGFLRSTKQAGSAHLVVALKKGLASAGFRDAENIAFEYRFADGQPNRLPALVRDLIGARVAVIVGNTISAEAAKAATMTLPIVFVTGSDPLRLGLIQSLNRPGGNVTGVVFTTGDLSAKRLALLHQLAPKAAVIGALLDVSSPSFVEVLRGVEVASRAIGRRIVIEKVASEREIEAAFTKIIQAGAGALFVGPGPLFLSRRQIIVTGAAQHALPASYATRQYVDGGGLMSYGTNQTDAYWQAGVYVARILKGDKPADLPVILTSKFELVLNLKTARTLGVTVGPSLLALADEVID